MLPGICSRSERSDGGMSTRLAEELAPIVRGITITSPTSFTFAGSLVEVPDPAPQPPPAAAGPEHSPNALSAVLQQWLYRYCYSRPFTGTLPEDAPALEDLVPLLSHENSSRDRWDGGWRIQQALPTGQVVAVKGALTRLFWPGEFLTQNGPGVPPQAGASISTFWPRELKDMQSGFYFVFGEGLADQQNDAALVRFYWNISADGAPRLVRLLTRELNNFRVPFRFKCPSARGLFLRVDTAVLYVGRRFYKICAMVVDDVTQRLGRYLDAPTPLFTKCLRPGLAFADDPRTGESFGMNRCRLVAEGLWTAHLQDERDEGARLGAVVDRFRADGLDPEHPYLNASSEDLYEQLYQFASVGLRSQR
jgi:type III HopA1-like effector protein